MAYNINRVILVGRLSNDIELKYTPSGAAVARFGLAVGGRPKPDGTDTVSFFQVVVWGKTAENCGNYLSKGKQIGIDGRLEQRNWTTQDGAKRSIVEVIAERVEFLSPMQTGAAPRQAAQPTQQGNDGAFYDNTGFDPTPIDPGFYDQEPLNDPNF